MESDKSNESGARKTITARAEEDCCAPNTSATAGVRRADVRFERERV
jgi:hypothetical protein